MLSQEVSVYLLLSLSHSHTHAHTHCLLHCMSSGSCNIVYLDPGTKIITGKSGTIGYSKWTALETSNIKKNLYMLMQPSCYSFLLHRIVLLCIDRWFLICSRGNLSLVIPKNKTLEHLQLKVMFISYLLKVYIRFLAKLCL